MITPLKTQVLIKPDELAKFTESGISILNPKPESQGHKGTVVAVGSQTRDLNVGDKVLYLIHSGRVIQIDNTSHVLLHETEVLGTII